MTTTLPDRGSADRVGPALGAAGWAACAQLAGTIASTYHWHGRIEHAAEWYCHLKTTLAAAPGLRGRLRELHPYDTPEIIALPIVDGDPAYLRWIADAVAGRSP